MKNKDEEQARADEETEWMVRFQNGEIQAFRAIFDRYATHLTNFAYRFLQTQPEAEDIAQETLIRVYREKERYDRKKPFRPWLFSIASHLISNQMRHRKRHPTESIDWRDEEGNENAAMEMEDKTSTTPENRALQGDLVENVKRALNDLPDAQRQAVILARFEEMSYDEIAAVLHTSNASVRSLLLRARKTLVKHLARFRDDVSDADR